MDKPSGPFVWWPGRRGGRSGDEPTALTRSSWLNLLKATFDAAGQGAISRRVGGIVLFGAYPPVFPRHPTSGLFRLIRSDLCGLSTLTQDRQPVWTPDQLVLAVA